MIIEKTHLDGVDTVINFLQTAFHARFLGNWNTGVTYQMWPRANKNPRSDGNGGENKVAEVSLDQKDYKEVLLDDNYDVSSFFLINDTRVYQDENYQIKQSISLIFQADLVKLYGEVYRADERFNMDVLRVLHRENKYIFGDINFIEGVDNVYSDLTFVGDFKQKMKIVDTSRTHVLKLTFDVIYRPNCNIRSAPVCTPAFYRNSDGTFTQSIDSGATFTAPDVTITINSTPNIVPANKDASFTVGGPTGVNSNVLNSGQETSYRSGDDGSRFLNGDYASVNLASLDDYYTLSDPNEWGHNKRITGDNGGYMDELTGNFFLVDGTPTDEDGAFPNGIRRDYATRRRWYFGRSGSRDWEDGIDLAQTDTRGGETGWYLPNRSEYESLSSNSSKTPTFIDSRLFNWPAFTMWSSTTNKNDTTQAYRYNSTSDTWTTAVKTQANGCAYVKLF